MMDKRWQVFAFGSGFSLDDILKTPWNYDDSLIIPRATWETVLALLGSHSTELSDTLDTYAKLDFNDKELNYAELSMLVNALKILSNNLEQAPYTHIIQQRIDKKLDQAFEISEYRRIITLFHSALERVVTAKSTFDSWID